MRKDGYLSRGASLRINAHFEAAHSSRFYAMALPCVFICLPGGVQVTGTPVPWWLIAASLGLAILSGAVFFAVSQRQVRRGLQEHVAACKAENIRPAAAILDALAD